MSIFFKKSIFGLDISDFSIEILQLSSKGKIKSFGRKIIEEGIVKDGFVINKKKLIEKIKEVIAQAKIKENRVILSLPESKIFTHLFRLPKNLKKKELKSVLESEVRKTIPWEIEKIYWDYQIIFPNLRNGYQAILFAGTLKEIIDDYTEILDEIGLEPVAFEMESMALGRALLKEKKPKAGIIIVDIGARTTNINIFDKNKVLIDSTTVFSAGNCFTESISQNLKISSKEAEKIKRVCGLDKKKGKGKVAKILEKELQPIIKKIKESIGYYGQEIEEILLVGGSSRILKISKFLSLNLGLKVDIGISPYASQLKRKSVLFNVVIGLALRGLERNPQKSGINLLPQKDRPKTSLVSKKTKRRKFFPYLGAGILILGLLLLSWVFYIFIFKSFSEKSSIKPETVSIEEEDSIKIGEENVPEEETQEQSTSSEEETVAFEEEKNKEENLVKIIIQETGTGWLNVRQGPGTNYPILTRIHPGESYPLLAETDNWYKIRLINEQEGWISILYATKNSEF